MAKSDQKTKKYPKTLKKVKKTVKITKNTKNKKNTNFDVFGSFWIKIGENGQKRPKTKK